MYNYMLLDAFKHILDSGSNKEPNILTCSQMEQKMLEVSCFYLYAPPSAADTERACPQT